MLATFSWICSSDSSVRSCDLPLGSPIIPVPPPTMAIGRCPNRCRRASAISGHQDADMEARRRRIESDVRGHALRRELFLQPFGGVGDHAAPLQLVEEIGVEIRHRGNGLLYQSMGATRRAVLKTLLATGVGALSGTGAYGFLYGRHELTVTRENVPVAGLPPALAGLRIGLMTDVHRSQLVSHEDVARAVGMLMSEQPGPHRARRRLRDLGRSALRRRRPPRRSPRSRRRTASTPSSATTTTITTCRWRWPGTASTC